MDQLRISIQRIAITNFLSTSSSVEAIAKEVTQQFNLMSKPFIPLRMQFPKISALNGLIRAKIHIVLDTFQQNLFLTAIDGYQKSISHYLWGLIFLCFSIRKKVPHHPGPRYIARVFFFEE